MRACLCAALLGAAAPTTATRAGGGDFRALAAPPPAPPPSRPAAAPPPPVLVRTPKVLAFNILVAGLSGLGKTTACEMLFHGWTHGHFAPQLGRLPSTRAINASRTFERHDPASNTKLHVTLVDTPGYGDRLDNKRAVRPICRYARDSLRRQFDVERSPRGSAGGADQQLHCCLYFVSPHRLLRTDVLFVRTLARFMPVVLVIAKADTLTDEELSEQRQHVRRVLRERDVPVYGWGEEDPSPAARGAAGGAAALAAQRARDVGLDALLSGPRYSRRRRPGEPLAVLARPAAYPWGAVDVENPWHSDFALLRDLLLSHHAEILIELAHERYGAFRKRRIRLEQLRGVCAGTALLGALARMLGLQPPACALRALLLALASGGSPSAGDGDGAPQHKAGRGSHAARGAALSHGPRRSPSL